MYTCGTCGSHGFTQTDHARSCTGAATSAASIVAAARPTWYPQTTPSAPLASATPPAQPAPVGRVATDSQIKYLTDLSDKLGIVPIGPIEMLSRAHISMLITMLRDAHLSHNYAAGTFRPRRTFYAAGQAITFREAVAPMPTPAPQPTPQPAPQPVPTAPDMLSKSVVDMIPVGRYGVRSDDRTEVVFLRVARPETGKQRGWTLITTKHSDSWQNRWAITPDGRGIGVLRYGTTWGLTTRHHTQPKIKGTWLSDVLIQIVSAPVQASVLYIEKVENECVRCGRELTDARSRHYHIGPECEHKRPDIISYMIETKGEYDPAIHN